MAAYKPLLAQEIAPAIMRKLKIFAGITRLYLARASAKTL
jgi:hypothetical protein